MKIEENKMKTAEEINKEFDELLKRHEEAMTKSLLSSTRRRGISFPDMDMRILMMGSQPSIVQYGELLIQDSDGFVTIQKDNEFVKVKPNILFNQLSAKDKKILTCFKIKTYTDNIGKLKQTYNSDTYVDHFGMMFNGLSGKKLGTKERMFDEFSLHIYASIYIYERFGYKIPIDLIEFKYDFRFRVRKFLMSHIYISENSEIKSIEFVVGKNVVDNYIMDTNHFLIKNVNVEEKLKYNLIKPYKFLPCMKFEVSIENPPACYVMTSETDILFEVLPSMLFRYDMKEDDIFVVSLEAIKNDSAILIKAKKHDLLRHIIVENKNPKIIDDIPY
jgi:hypothetical protein